MTAKRLLAYSFAIFGVVTIAIWAFGGFDGWGWELFALFVLLFVCAQVVMYVAWRRQQEGRGPDPATRDRVLRNCQIGLALLLVVSLINRWWLNALVCVGFLAPGVVGRLRRGGSS